MTSAGGPGSIARLITHSGGHSRPELRSGQIVRAQVLKQIGASKWMLGIGGRVVAASSEQSLRAGAEFTAQVRIQSGTIFLQPYEQVAGRDGAMRFLAAEGLPRDGLSLTIVRAMLRSGVALDPSRIQNLYTFFNSRNDVSPRLVRAYLLMQNKGMEPSAEGLYKIVDALDGRGGDAGGDSDGNNQGGGQHGHRQRSAGRHGSGRRHFGDTDKAGESSKPGGADGPENTHERDAEKALQELVARRDDEPQHLLQAFNHLTSKGGHWMVVPFSLSDEKHSYEGSLRIHFSTAGGTPSFDRAVASVAVVESEVNADTDTGTGSETKPETDTSAGGGSAGPGARSWSLEIVRPPAAEARHVRLFYPEGREPPGHLVDELQQRLSALGLGTFDVRSGGEFDGFSTEEGPDILKGVDTQA